MTWIRGTLGCCVVAVGAVEPKTWIGGTLGCCVVAVGAVEPNEQIKISKPGNDSEVAQGFVHYITLQM
jgi:hypothetical protein